jgi:hypothetical protein
MRHDRGSTYGKGSIGVPMSIKRLSKVAKKEKANMHRLCREIDRQRLLDRQNMFKLHSS